MSFTSGCKSHVARLFFFLLWLFFLAVLEVEISPLNLLLATFLDNVSFNPSSGLIHMDTVLINTNR